MPSKVRPSNPHPPTHAHTHREREREGEVMYDSERFEISKMIGRHTRTNKHTHTHTPEVHTQAKGSAPLLSAGTP